MEEYESHRRLLDALLSGDPDIAQQAIRAHIGATLVVLRASRADHPRRSHLAQRDEFRPFRWTHPDARTAARISFWVTMLATFSTIRMGAVLAGLAFLIVALSVSAATPDADPHITSIFPPMIAPGKPVEFAIRGKNLKAARDLWFANGGVQVRHLRVESADATEEVLRIELALVPQGAGTMRRFRVVTPNGVSNELQLRVVDAPIISEVTGPLTQFPILLAGTIAKRGDINTYPIAVQAGQKVSFQVRSGFRGFDPVLTIAERSGSWFDPDRINTLATVDEPLYFPGLSTDAQLTYRFGKAGQYLVRVASFSGQGGPDYVYDLKISPGELPPPVLQPHLGDAWEERQFTRPVPITRLAQVAARGAQDWPGKIAETFQAVPEGANETPVFSPPGLVVGRIAHPGEAHTIRLKIDKAEDLAIEIETPEGTMPRFNPVVRLMEPGGLEVVTNVYTKLNNNGLYMMKMIQPKTTFSLAAPGIYTLQIRDITTDNGGTDFHYRMLVRQRIPHIGKLTCSADHVNLRPGETRTIKVTLEREEDYAGVVAFTAENLPPGVTMIPALEKPPERPPLPNRGKLERYVANPQIASLLLMAAPDAPISAEPIRVRLLARPVVKGNLQEPIPAGEIPIMVVAGGVQ